MKIGILETGHLSDSLKAKYGRYPLMFERMLAPYLPDASFETVSVIDGEIPVSTNQVDGWIITGSRHGAYEDLQWIQDLMVFLRHCLADGIPVVGICFGHQILAQAMGGTVVNSEKGWGVGVQEYQTSGDHPLVADFTKGFTSHAIHQDQVVQAPKDTTVFASNTFCPIAGLLYGDPDHPNALSIQPHPEMSTEFVTDLANERLIDIIPTKRFEKGYKTLGNPVDNASWARTIARFFIEATAAP